MSTTTNTFLEGPLALVTGATSGIGRAVAGNGRAPVTAIGPGPVYTSTPSRSEFITALGETAPMRRAV